jgi:hypothetical protein
MWKKAAKEPLHGCGLYLKPALAMKRALLVYPESRREARINNGADRTFALNVYPEPARLKVKATPDVSPVHATHPNAV